MKIRIEEQDIRFKISEDELNTLISGHCLHIKTSFLEQTLITTINPQGVGKEMEPKLVLDKREVYLNLLVPSARIQELSDIGKSRSGLQQKIDGLSVSLQVDLRADSRKAIRQDK